VEFPSCINNEDFAVAGRSSVQTALAELSGVLSTLQQGLNGPFELMHREGDMGYNKDSKMVAMGRCMSYTWICIRTLSLVLKAVLSATVLSPLLYYLFTHDCVATHASNSIIKFADDTTVVGLITNNDETALQGGGEGPRSVVSGK
jgi:hypothetical protein